MNEYDDFEGDGRGGTGRGACRSAREVGCGEDTLDVTLSRSTVALHHPARPPGPRARATANRPIEARGLQAVSRPDDDDDATILVSEPPGSGNVYGKEGASASQDGFDISEGRRVLRSFQVLRTEWGWVAGCD